MSRDFAFAIGGAYTPGKVGREPVARMARELGMQPPFVCTVAAEAARKLPAALAGAVDTVSAVLSAGGRKLAERLSQFVLSTTAKTSARLLGE